MTSTDTSSRAETCGALAYSEALPAVQWLPRAHLDRAPMLAEPKNEGFD
jgi:hypothetical protein